MLIEITCHPEVGERVRTYAGAMLADFDLHEDPSYPQEQVRVSGLFADLWSFSKTLDGLGYRVMAGEVSA